MPRGPEEVDEVGIVASVQCHSAENVISGAWKKGFADDGACLEYPLVIACEIENVVEDFGWEGL